MSYEAVVDPFVCAARRFCAAAEEIQRGQRPATALAKALTAAYAAALELPSPSPTSDELLEVERIDASPICAALEGAFGDGDKIRLVFDPTEPDPNDPYTSSISQELSEIYEDLMEAISLVEKFGPSADCTWQLWFAFDAHWGQHAMHALPALHQLRRFETFEAKK